MGAFSIGQPVLRKEDPRLLKGQGRYLDDRNMDRQARAVIVRSPHAHARIVSIDTAAAAAAPGVLAVLTGADWRGDGMGVVPCMGSYSHRNGGKMYIPDRPALAIGKVVNVGYPVVLVVADTEAQARDAAELVAVDYEPLPAVTSCYDAFQDGAPQLYEDCPNNESYLYRVGDRDAVEAAFADADHTIEQRLVINRITANALEPRAVIGEYDAGSGRYTINCGFQRPWLFRRSIAEQSFHVPESKVRLVTGDIGGSYGLRGSIYPEMVMMPWAAQRVGRPVKWVADRVESHLADDDGRDNIVDAAIAFDADGTFRAVKIRSWGNLGGYVSYRGAAPPAVHIGSAIGVYTTPVAYAEISGMLTNTHCTSPYRGAGRPEAAYMIERLVEMAADELGMDPAELRRRNVIPPEAMPYKTPLTYTYDSGRFEENMDRAMAMADWAGFPARRAESEARGRLRGIGMSNTIEWAADTTMETAELRFDPGGDLTFVASSISHGQGHQTIQTQILVSLLGVDPDRVAVLQGDTDVSTYGMGTGGSRSTTMTSAALTVAAQKVIDKGRKLAAHLLEAAEADIEFADGEFSVAGTDKRIGIHEVAAGAYRLDDLPAGFEPGLYETGSWKAETGNFPNGCHICEVEIDPDTGATDIVGYWVVDDVGTIINPMLVKGQIMGGIGQGLGQVLMEDKTYDPETGQLIAGSFMDYCMPRADDFCDVAFQENVVPTPTNPLGAKGAGEAGTVGSLSAGVNAIVDALSPLGVRHVDTPCTPLRVWEAMQKARAG
ncbi:MAG: xanthine dehydrogenase family protein molybdopterin-binding subunit [Alphaproteobacteria bacterium]